MTNDKDHGASLGSDVQVPAVTEAHPTSHTPGPWLAYYSSLQPPSAWVGTKITNVARILTGGRTKAVVDANANLIAAAPDMKQGLADIHRLLEAESSALATMIRATCEALIAKAEGR